MDPKLVFFSNKKEIDINNIAAKEVKEKKKPKKTEKKPKPVKITLSNLENVCKSPTNITKLNLLQPVKEYITSAKKINKCKLSMIDINKQITFNFESGSLPGNKHSLYNCFWCRHSFETLPLGCPIDFIPTAATKKYISCINNDTYKILENISDVQKSRTSESDKSLSFEPRNYYTSDGIFCSFNCCQAYINDNSKMTLYQNSSFLLIRIYLIFLEAYTPTSIDLKKENISINPASHWRTLLPYGGSLSIEEFRSSFNKIIYRCTGKSNSPLINITNVTGPINYLPIQHEFEEISIV
jgi:hypothetical protein